MNKEKWKVIDFKIGDIVIWDWYVKGSGEKIAKTGEIVYISKGDNTVNIKDFFSNTIVNIGKEKLILELLTSNTKINGYIA